MQAAPPNLSYTDDWLPLYMHEIIDYMLAVYELPTLAHGLSVRAAVEMIQIQSSVILPVMTLVCREVCACVPPERSLMVDAFTETAADAQKLTQVIPSWDFSGKIGPTQVMACLMVVIYSYDQISDPILHFVPILIDIPYHLKRLPVSDAHRQLRRLAKKMWKASQMPCCCQGA